VAAKKAAQPKKSTAEMSGMDMASPPASSAKAPFQFRGRTIEILPPGSHDKAMAHAAPGHRMLRVDGRPVMYEQTDEGVYSHEAMYQRFSTPEELAEELVRQWGTHLPAPAPMTMAVPRPKRAGAKRAARGSRRRARR